MPQWCRQYRRAAHNNTTHIRRQNFYALPSAQWEMLSEPPFSMLDTFSKVDDAIDANANLAEAILASGLVMMGYPDPTQDASDSRPEWHDCASKVSLDKARSTLHQLYRDWSAEGAAERQACYGPILQDLTDLLVNPQEVEEQILVLVPGAGLGRLVFELCRAGFCTQGNEISYHQLLASSYMLNHTSMAEMWSLYPFATTFSNNLTRAHQLLEVKIPDVHPGSEVMHGDMSMTTGDFCVVYTKMEYKDFFHAIATVFFIDTAADLVTYVLTAKHCLRPGGLWCNLGPLLWHFDGESARGDKSHEGDDVERWRQKDPRLDEAGENETLGRFEMSHDEVMALVERLGFVILKQEIVSPGTGYIQNPNSMLQNIYRPVHWVARKR